MTSITIRLAEEKDSPGIAVFLKRHGWYRIDPRGDKAGIQTDFCPPGERLAFALARQGEMDVSGRFADALPGVVSALQKWTTADEVARNLPDYVMESGDWGSAAESPTWQSRLNRFQSSRVSIPGAV